jgi:DNA-binding protein HU-beta
MVLWVDLLYCSFLASRLVKCDRFTLVGFGSFEPRDRQEREGRNPRTGEKMVIAATRVPAFSAGKQFKDKVVEEQKIS